MHDNLPPSETNFEHGSEIELDSGRDHSVLAPPKPYSISIDDKPAELVLDMDKPDGTTLNVTIGPFPEADEKVEVSSKPEGHIDAVEVEDAVSNKTKPQYKIKPVKPGEVELKLEFPITKPGMVTETLKVKVRAIPFVDVAKPKIVLVNKDYLKEALKEKPGPQRLEVALGIKGVFDGTAKLEVVEKGKIKLFDGPDADARELGESIDYKKGELDAGKVVYAEGVAASSALDSTELKLTLEGGTVPFGDPASDKMTCVELEVQLFKPEPDNSELAAAQKFKPGAVLDLAAKPEESQRAKVVVKKAKPDSFEGKVEIRLLNDKLRLFARKDPKVRDPFSADSVENKRLDLELWLEGAQLSAEKEDTGIEVGLADLEASVGDRATCTVRAMPVIEVVEPGFALVHNPELGEEPCRLEVVLKATGGPLFKGKATLRKESGDADLFVAANASEPPTEFTAASFGNPVELKDGVAKVYVVGKKEGKLGLALELKPESAATPEPGGPAKAEVECVKLQLDVYTCKTADAEPKVYDKKLDPGRYLAKVVTGESERAKVVIKKPLPETFKGTVTLFVWDEEKKAAGNAVAVYDKETGGDPLETVELEGLSEDRELWVAPNAASAKMKDVSLRLGIKDLKTPGGDPGTGDKVVFTVLEASLQLHESRTKEGVDPEALSAGGKLEEGRFVHVLQDKHHGRAWLTLGDVKPASFDGKFCLRIDDKNTLKPSDRVAIFDAEVPPAGAEKPVSTEYGKEELKLWVGGKKASDQLCDTLIHLGIKDHVGSCDKVALTVVEFSKLKAEWQEGEEKKDFEVAKEAPAAKDYDESFETNKPLKRISWSVAAKNSFKLSVAVQPEQLGEKVLWAVLPVKGAAAPERAAPIEDAKHNLQMNNLQAQLDTTMAGNFHVVAYLPCDNEQKFNGGQSESRIDKQPFILMNLELPPAPRVFIKLTGEAGSGGKLLKEGTEVELKFDDKDTVKGTMKADEFIAEGGEIKGFEFDPEKKKSFTIELPTEQGLFFVDG